MSPPNTLSTFPHSVFPPLNRFLHRFGFFQNSDSPRLILFYSTLTTVATVPTLLFSNLHMDCFLTFHRLQIADVVRVQAVYSVWNALNDIAAGILSDVFVIKFNLTRVSYLKYLSYIWVLTALGPFLISASDEAEDHSRAALLYFICIFLYDGCASFAVIARYIVSCFVSATEGERVALMRWNSLFGPLEFVFVGLGLYLYGSRGRHIDDEADTVPKSFQIYLVLLVLLCVGLIRWSADALDEVVKLDKKEARRLPSEELPDLGSLETLKHKERGLPESLREERDTCSEPLDSPGAVCAALCCGPGRKKPSREPPLTSSVLSLRNFLSKVNTNFWLHAVVFALGEMQAIFSSQFLLVGLQKLGRGADNATTSGALILFFYGAIGAVGGALRLALTFIAPKIGVYRIVAVLLTLKLFVFVFGLVLWLVFEGSSLKFLEGYGPHQPRDDNVGLSLLPLSVFCLLVLAHESAVNLHTGFSNIILNNLIDEHRFEAAFASETSSSSLSEEEDPMSRSQRKTKVEVPEEAVPAGYFFSLQAVCVKPLNSVAPVLGALWLAYLNLEDGHMASNHDYHTKEKGVLGHYLGSGTDLDRDMASGSETSYHARSSSESQQINEENDNPKSTRYLTTFNVVFFQFLVGVAQWIAWRNFKLKGDRLKEVQSYLKFGGRT